MVVGYGGVDGVLKKGDFNVFFSVIPLIFHQYIRTMDTPTNENKWYGVVFVICILVAAAVAVMPWLGTVGMADPKTADTQGLWINFLGKFHFVVLHLPIGATAVVLCMESLGIISFGRYKPRTTMALAFAAGTAVVAVVFGYFLYLTGKYNVDELDDHKRFGVIFTVVLILTFLIKFSYDVKKLGWLKPGYILALLGTGGMMYVAGHEGGEQTHGDPLNHLPSKIAAKREEKRAADLVAAADPVIYSNIVHNILQNKCISCHGEDKVKGGLRLDSLAAMFKGGDEEEALVAGDVEGSYMLTTISLPMEDDMHMPPKAKPQVTAEELKVLKWWVAMGAPEKTKLSEVKDIPEEITLAIATLKTPEELAEQKEKMRLAEEKSKKAFSEKRAKLKSALDSVNKAFPGSLRYSSQADTDLVFNTVSYRKQFKATDLEALGGVAADVKELDLSSTLIGDEVKDQLGMFVNLRNLKLSGTKVTDETLKVLGTLENLRSLNLYGTEVSDEGIMELAKLKHIEKIYLWNTRVTFEGAEKLKESLISVMHQDSEEDKRPDPVVDLGLKSAKL